MSQEKVTEIALNSGNAQLMLSQSTGKLTRLCIGTQNLLVEPKPDEWVRGLLPNSSNVFDSTVAWGGDECFPNVAASEVWGLRDHGNIWGQQPEIVHSHRNTCTVIWKQNQIHFKREIRALSLPENSAVAGAFEFEMSYPTSIPLIETDEDKHSYLQSAGLYAWHTLFEMSPGDTVSWGTLSEIPDAMQLATGAWKIQTLTSRSFAPNSQAIASKFYIETGKSGAFATSIMSKSRNLRIDVIQDNSLPWLGIWWCHNGWGDGRPHSTVGIEPTNIPSDGPILKFGSAVNSTPEIAKIMTVITKLSES